MIPFCLALIGHICISRYDVPQSGPQTTIVITTTSLYQVAQVRSFEWRAQFILGGDTSGPVYFKTKAVQEACRDATCVKYHRKCDDAIRPKNCDNKVMSVAVSPNIAANPIHVEGDSQEAFRVAERSLSVIVNQSGSTVPLAAMNLEATVLDPFCHAVRGQQIEQDCVELTP